MSLRGCGQLSKSSTFRGKLTLNSPAFSEALEFSPASSIIAPCFVLAGADVLVSKGILVPLTLGGSLLMEGSILPAELRDSIAQVARAKIVVDGLGYKREMLEIWCAGWSKFDIGATGFNSTLR